MGGWDSVHGLVEGLTRAKRSRQDLCQQRVGSRAKEPPYATREECGVGLRWIGDQLSNRAQCQCLDEVLHVVIYLVQRRLGVPIRSARCEIAPLAVGAEPTFARLAPDGAARKPTEAIATALLGRQAAHSTEKSKIDGEAGEANTTRRQADACGQRGASPSVQLRVGVLRL